MDENERRAHQAEEPFDEPTENDPTRSVEEGEPYFPPTDPVVRTTRDGRVEIASGFGGAPNVRPAATATDRVASDEAIADAVRVALALDAGTAGLDVRVRVRDAVVTLDGEVADSADADNAVAVAGDVPGVADVIDELRSA